MDVMHVMLPVREKETARSYPVVCFTVWQSKQTTIY